MTPECLIPDWQLPKNVRARFTTRRGGVSQAPYGGFNLGDHVGDDAAAVAANRALLRQQLPAEPVWLQQVHGTTCVDASTATPGTQADAVFARQSGVVCAVLTADCLPVLLCDAAGTVVAAAHAGWRGLLAGVIEATVTAMQLPGERLVAWLGPAIGPHAFEVGSEVRDAFIAHDGAAASAFIARANGKWLCNLYRLAQLRLGHSGVCRLAGADFCTLTDRDRFFSYRRDGMTGRMASLIWID